MKKTYFFLISLVVLNFCYGQNDCSVAQSHIVYAFNNAKLSLEANNITHVKYYANKSLESFKKVDESLGNCNCTNVSDLTYMSIEKLQNVDGAEKMHDAQYFVGKAKGYAQEIITELDACTIYSSEEKEVVELSALEQEQQKLKEEQELIKLKQQQLQMKIAQQAEKEQYLEKEQLIITTEAALNQNIKAYKDLLDACKCNKTANIEMKKEDKDKLISKSIGEIRKHYLESLKTITNDYIATLDDCDVND